MRMTTSTMMGFVEWAGKADLTRTGDPLWSVQAYRLGLYAIECLTFDRQVNTQLNKAAALDQLTRAVGSVSANIAEGYSRSSLADRNRFYGYALGSTREAIAWYDAVRIELGERVDDRQATLIQVRRLLLTTLRKTRPDGASAIFRDSAPKSPKPED